MREQMKVRISLLGLIFIFILGYSCSQNGTRQEKGNIDEKSTMYNKHNLHSDIDLNKTLSLKFVNANGNIDGYWIRFPRKYNKQKL